MLIGAATMVIPHGGVDRGCRGGAASGIKQATLYAYVSRGVLRRRRGPDGRSSLFDPAEIAGMTDRARPRRAGGAAGFVFESAVTEISDGRPRYRGMDVTKLALWRPFEEVAEWLWTGTYAKEGRPPWQATQEGDPGGDGRAGRAARRHAAAGTAAGDRARDGGH
jgi:citrate synthase